MRQIRNLLLGSSQAVEMINKSIRKKQIHKSEKFGAVYNGPSGREGLSEQVASSPGLNGKEPRPVGMTGRALCRWRRQ